MADMALLSKQELGAPEALREAILRVSRRCWAGEQPIITRTDLWHEIRNDPEIPAADRERLAAVLLAGDTGTNGGGVG